MARVKSFTAKANRGKVGAVLVNNMIASSQKKIRQKKRETEAARARQARETERARARKAREAEKERVSRERSAERARVAEQKQRAKRDKKLAEATTRLKLEFSKAGLYPAPAQISNFAATAVSAAVTPSKLRTFFIDGKEEALARQCALEFLESKGITNEFEDLKTYPMLVEIVSKTRPQAAAEEAPEWEGLKARMTREIHIYERKKARADERKNLIDELLRTKLMFQEDIEDFAETIHKNDWSRDQSLASDIYQRYLTQKAEYVAQIKAQIVPVKL